jgi:branched-chain amino acid aminotransferase
VKLDIPPAREDLLLREIEAALAHADHGESYVRVIVTRGVTAIGLAVGESVKPRRVIVVLPLAAQPAALYDAGVAVATVSMARSLDGTGAAGAKASNYLPNILSLESARRKGAYEAISVAAGGELLEGSTSNLFVVKDGQARTPPLGIGILGGITRRVVIEAAHAAGIELREVMLFPPDLYRADEAFITSTLREVIPVVQADGVPIGTGEPGPVTRALHAAFRAQVRALLPGR